MVTVLSCLVSCIYQTFFSLRATQLVGPPRYELVGNVAGDQFLFFNKKIHYDEHLYVLLSDGDHHIMLTHVDYNVVSSLRRHYALLIEDGGLIDGLSLGQHCALYRSTQLPIGRICYLYVWEHSSPDQSNLIL